ncbi:hypothetical protein J6590_088406 [Homalodisca vitripennis]|nr:hypothetical protein J6590_088406 [Homalodisca vitripennis]
MAGSLTKIHLWVHASTGLAACLKRSSRCRGGFLVCINHTVYNFLRVLEPNAQIDKVDSRGASFLRSMRMNLRIYLSQVPRKKGKPALNQPLVKAGRVWRAPMPRNCDSYVFARELCTGLAYCAVTTPGPGFGYV